MPAVELLTDDLTGPDDADITGRTAAGGTWGKNAFWAGASTLDLAGGVLIHQGGASFDWGVYTLQGATALPTSHWVETQGRFVASDANALFLLTAHQDPALRKGYLVSVFATGALALQKRTAAVALTLASTSVAASIVLGQVHTIRLCLTEAGDGLALKVFFDDVLKLCVLDDTPLTGDDPGVGIGDPSGVGGTFVEVTAWSAGSGCMGEDLVQINGLQPRKNGAFRPEPVPSVRAKGGWRGCDKMWEWARGAWRPLFGESGAGSEEPLNNCYRQHLGRAIYGLQYTTSSSPSRLYGPDGASVAATILSDTLTGNWPTSTLTALHDGGIVNHLPRQGSIFGLTTAARSFIPGSLGSGVNVVTAAAATPAVEELLTPAAPFACASLAEGLWFATYGAPATPGDFNPDVPVGTNAWYAVFWTQDTGLHVGEVSVTIGTGGNTVEWRGAFDGSANWKTFLNGSLSGTFAPAHTGYPGKAQNPALGGVYVGNFLAVRMTGAFNYEAEWGTVTQYPGRRAYVTPASTVPQVAQEFISGGVGGAVDPLTVHYDFDPSLGTDLAVGTMYHGASATTNARLFVGAADGSAIWVYAPPVGGAISGYTLERTIDMTPYTAIRGMYEDKTRGCCYVLADDDLLRIDMRQGATVLVLDLGAGSEPFEMIEHFNQSLYITCTGSDEVVVVDQIGWTVTDRIAVGSQPHGIGWRDGSSTSGTPTSYIYVANTGDDTVSEIDPTTNTVTRTIAVDDEPWGILPYGDAYRRMRVGHVAGQTVVAIV